MVGGSGLDQIDGLTDVRQERVEGPFGPPSDLLTFGRIGETRVVFLPRHGRGHRHNPSEINYKANIDALKRAGCSDLLSLSAVGSLREDLSPGTFVIVDQFVDRTFARAKTFFGSGVVAHASMARPVCPRLAGFAAEAARAAGARALVLVHLPPGTTEAGLGAARAVFPETRWGVEGEHLVVAPVGPAAPAHSHTGEAV